MTKRKRNLDNSKRQQPIAQQRAQARQPGSSGPKNSGEPQARQDNKDEPKQARQRKQ
jgi:hypothetical protein